MTSPFKKLMLVTDTLHDSQAAAESAASIAMKHDASLLVVDTIQAPSRAARWFSANANDVFEMVVADKEQRLDAFVDRLRALGINASSKVLIGKSSAVLTQEVADSEIDLLIRYRKGLRSKHPGAFGNTARILMRVCPCALLFVHDTPIERPRVLACVDASHEDSENNPILEHAQLLANEDEDLFGIYCWNFVAADLLSKRMSPDAYQYTLNEAEELYGGIFQRFCEAHDLSRFGDRMQIEKGEPAAVIPEICEQRKIDIAVMSSIALNNPVLRLLGSTVESVMDRLPCSLLIVKPVGFEHPASIEAT